MWENCGWGFARISGSSHHGLNGSVTKLKTNETQLPDEFSIQGKYIIESQYTVQMDVIV